MEKKQQWIARLKHELSHSHLVSNVAFGFILMGLEKLVELEFECPCNPKWNKWFSSAFFIIPAIMAFILMLIIEECRSYSSHKKNFSSFVSSLVPAFVWLSMLFFDGQYLACAMTDWEGRFVLVDKAAPQKWCEPIGERNDTQQELMLRSQRLFVYSQGIGIVLLTLICVGLVVYVIRECCKPEVKKPDADVAERTGLRMSAGEDSRV
ncbi:uncharacterized protein LOC103373783 [Stegastes partitus]|uniref:Uncharacterized protein LOC103373783 n=1 Tax=Stegastes partitus TaxID=144197 RepID=A0A9Y4NR43_9TELE|nr:PREDICTED: uncharacterized protein LOC103373783 [Stegastes partitus]